MNENEEGKACIDYGLHMTFTERVPERTIAACVEAGITSFKLYMAYPELLQVDDESHARHWLRYSGLAAEWLTKAGIGAYPPVFVGRFRRMIHIA